MLIPVDYAQVNVFMPVSQYPYVPQCTFGVDTREFVGTTTEFAEAIYDIWSTEWAGFLTSNVTFDKVRVKYGPNATGPAEEFGGSASGAVSGESVEPSVAALVTKNTSLGGRQGRGRFYLPGMPESYLNPGGDLTSTGMLQGQSCADAWLAAMNTANIPPVLLHGVGTSDTTPEEITSLTLQGRYGSQRRRNRR